jgi:membrane protease YdiL (CAAX protease family)
MDDRTTADAGWWLRVARFPLIYLGLLYLVLTYLYLSGHFFRAMFAQGPWQGVAASVMSCAMMLVLYATLSRVIERREVTELALRPAAREAGIGLLVGFTLYSVCIAILTMLGIYRIEGLNAWLILVAGFAAPLATGVFEELVFRGGVFRIAEKWCGTWIALAISSVVFGVVHLENETATIRGIVFISIWAGILLAATYILTRRLWVAMGLHAAWNFTQGTVYSGIVSGNEAPTGFVRSTMQGPEWLTGGSFGVEASVLALVICSGVGIAMLVVAARRGNIVAPPWQK